MPSESAPEQQSPDHLIGETLANRYQIEHKLGEGAMGSVYRARHVKVGRAFAVKVLHSRIDDDKVAQRFEREAELAGRLSHANVIGVVDVGETPDGLRYMVMDFAEGEDLAGMLTEAPFRRDRIVRLTRQLLEGLFHAHEAGLIHRDFKPENVIISKDDHGEEVPRIVDFGIAILREGGDSSSSEGRLTTNGLVLGTPDGTLMGTPHYMAPEQAVADPIDHRIDLFALGIVIYEMLCGKLPFDGTGAEVARANLLLDPPPISQRVPYLEVDPLLEAFARRLMAKRRDERPPTARDAREILDLIDQDPVKAAALLGVPLERARLPLITQEVSHQPPAVESTSMPAPAPQATRAASQPSEVTREVVIGGVMILGVAIAIFVMKSHGSAKPREPDKTVAMTPTPPEPVPQPDPKPTEPVVQPPDPTPVEIDMPVDTTTRRPVQPIKRPTPAIAKELPVKAPIETPAPAAPTTDQVNALYAAVARDIGAVASKHGNDAASELWRRYRMIQIQNATVTPGARLEVSATLAKLQQDALAKK